MIRRIKQIQAALNDLYKKGEIVYPRTSFDYLIDEKIAPHPKIEHYLLPCSSLDQEEYDFNKASVLLALENERISTPATSLRLFEWIDKLYKDDLTPVNRGDIMDLLIKREKAKRVVEKQTGRSADNLSSFVYDHSENALIDESDISVVLQMKINPSNTREEEIKNKNNRASKIKVSWSRRNFKKDIPTFKVDTQKELLDFLKEISILQQLSYSNLVIQEMIKNREEEGEKKKQSIISNIMETGYNG